MQGEKDRATSELVLIKWDIEVFLLIKWHGLTLQLGKTEQVRKRCKYIHVEVRLEKRDYSTEQRCMELTM